MKIKHLPTGEVYKFHAWSSGTDADHAIVSTLSTGEILSLRNNMLAIVHECKDCASYKSEVCVGCIDHNKFEWR